MVRSKRGNVVSIIAVYTAEPSFPPTDQNAIASRVRRGQVWIDYTGGEPTAQDIAAFLRPRRRRTLPDITADLNALSNPQKVALWSDLTSGSPPRLFTSTGPNAGAIGVLHLIAGGMGIGNALMLEAKIRAAAMYLQDNPRYLRNPSFDESIDISGEE